MLVSVRPAGPFGASSAVSCRGAVRRQPSQRVRLQALNVEPVGRLGDRRGSGIGAAGILQVGHHAPVLVEREHVAIRRRHRPHRLRQPQCERAHPRPVRLLVDEFSPGLDQPGPDAPVAAAHQVVGKAGKIRENHSRRAAGRLQRRPRALSLRIRRDFPDAVLAGLGHEHVLLVGGEREAVGKAQVREQHPHAARLRIELQQPAGAAVLDGVEHAGGKGAAPFLRREAARRIGEIDAAVVRDHDGIGIADRIARHRLVHAVRQQLDARRVAASGHAQQPAMGTPHGVGDDQRAARIEIEAQGTPAGAHDDLARRTVRVHSHDAPAAERNVDPGLAVLVAHHHMLGAFVALERKVLQRLHPIVRREGAAVAGIDGGVPGHRRNRRRPKQQEGRRQCDQHGDNGEYLARHFVVLVRSHEGRPTRGRLIRHRGRTRPEARDSPRRAVRDAGNGRRRRWCPIRRDR